MWHHYPCWIGIWRSWFLCSEENQRTWRKHSSQGMNQQDTQPTYGIRQESNLHNISGMWTLSPLCHSCSSNETQRYPRYNVLLLWFILILKQQVSVALWAVTVLDESFEGGTKAGLNQLVSLIYIRVATRLCIWKWGRLFEGKPIKQFSPKEAKILLKWIHYSRWWCSLFLHNGWIILK